MALSISPLPSLPSSVPSIHASLSGGLWLSPISFILDMPHECWVFQSLLPHVSQNFQLSLSDFKYVFSLKLPDYSCSIQIILSILLYDHISVFHLFSSSIRMSFSIHCFTGRQIWHNNSQLLFVFNVHFIFLDSFLKVINQLVQQGRSCYHHLKLLTGNLLKNFFKISSYILNVLEIVSLMNNAWRRASTKFCFCFDILTMEMNFHKQWIFHKLNKQHMILNGYLLLVLSEIKCY